MKMREIFSFEVNYQLRRSSTWIYFLTIVALLVMVIGEMAEHSRMVEHVLLNSPLVVADITGYANKFGLLLIAVLAGDAATRDVQSGVSPLVYTCPLSKVAYLGGRFLGSCCTSAIILVAAVPLSLLVAKFVQGLEPGLFGDSGYLAFLSSALFITLPSVCFVLDQSPNRPPDGS